jgi:antitoxin component YwqK of YwqJK toxin-antitoxin module
VIRVHDEELICDACGYILYHKGKLFTGIAYTEFPNGQLETEIEYKEGAVCGLDREWYQDSTLEHEYHVKNGAAHGSSKAWHPNGKPKHEALYEFGIKIYEKKWNENGQLLKVYDIENDKGNLSLLHHRRGIKEE